MIQACIISFLLAAIVYTGAFFLFQTLDYFKKTNADTGERVPDKLMIAVYSAYAALPVLFISLLIFYMKAKAKLRHNPVYNMCPYKQQEPLLPAGNFL